AVPYRLPTQVAGIAAGQWQISEGYEFTRVELRGLFPAFATNGFNSSVVRFFGRQLGVEGDLGAGFARSTPGASASSIFFGAGPHIAFRGRRHFEPWGHGLVGAQHLAFGGNNVPVTSTTLAWVAGGGLDYHFDSGFALRVEADYLGTHFGGVFRRNLRI